MHIYLDLHRTGKYNAASVAKCLYNLVANTDCANKNFGGDIRTGLRLIEATRVKESAHCDVSQATSGFGSGLLVSYLTTWLF